MSFPLPASRAPRLLLGTALGLALLLTVGCGGSTETPMPVPAQIVVSGADAALLPGATVQLSARVASADGTVIPTATVTWSSTNAAVASVSGSGLVTAIAAGTTSITATSGSASGSATVQVNAGGLVSASGGTVQAAGGAVSLTFPAGAVASTLPVAVTPKPDTVRTAHTASSAYLFGPSGTQFSQPVTMALRYDPAALPAHTDKASLRVAKLINGAWTPLTEGVQVDSAGNTVRAQTRSFSTYAVVRDPCLPQDGSASTITGAIATDDCVATSTGRRTDYYAFSAPANTMTVIRSSGTLDGIVGFKQTTADATTGTVYDSDNVGRELRLIGNGAPLQLFVTGRDSTKFGTYSFNRLSPAPFACPSTATGVPLVAIMPSAQYAETIAASNSCTVTVQFSPIPAAIGKPLLTHNYAVKLDAGNRYTIAVSNTAPQSALTVFSNGAVVAQNVSATGGLRSVTFTAAASAYYVIELSSGGFTNADFSGPWVNPSFAYTVSVSASPSTTCTMGSYTIGATVSGNWSITDCQNSTSFAATDAYFDQYELAVTTQQNVRFELTGAAGRTVRIRRSNTTQYVGLPTGTAFTTVNGNTLLQRHLLAPGNYVVEVQAPANTTGSYTLASVVDNGDVTCRPIVQGTIGFTFTGRLEPATDCVSPGGSATDVEDWFVMPLTTGDKFRITLTTTDMAAGFVLRDDRLGPASPTLAVRTSTTPGTITLDWTATFDTYHEIVVFRNNRATPLSTYTLSVQRLP